MKQRRRRGLLERISDLESIGWSYRFASTRRVVVTTHTGATFTIFVPQGNDVSIPFMSKNSLKIAERNGLLEAERRRDEINRCRRTRALAVDAATNAVPTGVGDDDDGSDRCDSHESKRERVSAMASKTQAVERGALGYVNNVAIAEIAPARIETPISHGPRPMKDAEELLLEDETVVYRCRKPAAMPHKPDLTGICNHIAPTAQSLRAHITFHSRQTLPTAPSASKKARKTRSTRSTRSKSKTAVSSSSSSSSSPPPLTSNGTLPNLVAKVNQIATDLAVVAETMVTVTRTLQDVADDLADVSKKVGALPVTNAETIEKAQRYDRMMQAVTES